MSDTSMKQFLIYQGEANLNVCHSKRTSIWAMQGFVVLVMP